ncbi:MAG: hypothetical protein ACI9I0_000158, partial [Rhodoferax sp.]
MSDFDHFAGTQAVANNQAFNVVALTTWLEKNLPDLAGPVTVESFKG